MSAQDGGPLAPVSGGEPVPSLGLDHVQLASPPGGETAARRFYGELLGLAELEKPVPLQTRGGVWFALGDGRQLHIGVEARFVSAGKARSPRDLLGHAGSQRASRPGGGAGRPPGGPTGPRS